MLDLHVERPGSSVDPTLSVVFITRNRQTDVLQSIQSVIAQDIGDYEILVVDQGSTDGTCAAVAARFPQVRVLPLEVNIGVAGGRAVGSAAARGRYLVFIDDDASFRDADALRQIAALFEEHPDLGIVGFRIVNGESGVLSNWCYPAAMRPYSGVPFEAVAFVGCGHAVRKVAFDAAGGYDVELFFWGEELGLALRLLDRTSYRIAYWPGVVVLHRFAEPNRHAWKNSRLYYMTRNRILLIWWYYPDWISRVFASCCYAFGYMLRAAVYRAPWQYLSGLRDAVHMFRTTGRRAPMSRLRFNHFRSLLWRQRLAGIALPGIRSWGGLQFVKAAAKRDSGLPPDAPKRRFWGTPSR